MVVIGCCDRPIISLFLILPISAACSGSPIIIYSSSSVVIFSLGSGRIRQGRREDVVKQPIFRATQQSSLSPHPDVLAGVCSAGDVRHFHRAVLCAARQPQQRLATARVFLTRVGCDCHVFRSDHLLSNLSLLSPQSKDRWVSPILCQNSRSMCVFFYLFLLFLLHFIDFFCCCVC